MGAGAVKPGQTLQGKGTGTVQPSRPTLAPAQGASIPAQGGKTVGPQNTLQPGSQIFGGTVTPNTIGPNGLPVGGTMPAGYNGPIPGVLNPGDYIRPGINQPIPAQGGKFPSTPQQPTTSNIPGYAQPYANALNPQAQQPAPGQFSPPEMTQDRAAKLAEMERMMRQGSQVPSQGGKAPLTPEQRAAISANADPARGLGLNLGDMLYGGGGQQPQVQPQVLPQQISSNPTNVLTPMAQTPSNLPSYAQPAYNNLMAQKLAARPTMPRPTMTRPSSIGAGLAALRGRR